MRKLLALMLLLGQMASADTPPLRSGESDTFDGSRNAITSTVNGAKRGLDFHLINAASDPGLFSIIVSGSAVDPRDRNWSLLNTTDSITSYQGGNWNLRLVDSIGTMAVIKPAATAPTVADPSLVVAISPNSPITVTSVPPTDSNSTGSITTACASGIGCASSSYIMVATAGRTTLGYETHGTWSGTMVTEVSFDALCSTGPGSALWLPVSSVDTSSLVNAFFNNWTETANGHPWVMNVAGAQCARIRSSALNSGSVSVTMDTAVGTGTQWVYALGGATAVRQDTLDTDLLAFKLANHTDLGTLDTDLLAFKVANHTDEGAILTKQGDGSQKSQSVDASGNVHPAADTTARAEFAKVTDGTSTMAVKAASTSPAAADPAGVVVVSPNGNHATAAKQDTLDIDLLAFKSANHTDLGAVTTSTNTIGTNQTNGTQKAQAVDGSGNVHPAADTVARAEFAKVTDGTSTMAVKAASVAPGATDPAGVVALSPNGNQATAALQTTTDTDLNTFKSANHADLTQVDTDLLAFKSANHTDLGTLATNQTNGTQKAQAVDASGNVHPAADTVARAEFAKVTDGTNTQAVKAASTAPAATDPAGVVALSPNGNQSTAAKQDTLDTDLNAFKSANHTDLTAAQPRNIQASNGAAINLDSAGNLGTQPRGNSFNNITTATTTTIKTGAGHISTVCLNTTVNNATLTLFANTAGSGTKIGTYTGLQGGGAANTGCWRLDADFTVGLTAVTTNAADWTVVYY